MDERQLINCAMISAAVMTLGVGLYDVAVRQPRTPRLAVVDIAQLYGLAQQQAARKVLTGMEAAASSPAAAGEAEKAIRDMVRSPQDFGPAISATLADLSKECRCTLVAMAAVFGADSSVPDYTAEAAQRMGLDYPARGSAGSGTNPTGQETQR